jgi:MFS family permease
MSQNPEEIMFRVDICERNLKPENNSTYKKIPRRLYLEKGEEFSGEFNWSESQQGFILGSFFWGYLLTQIPGGWLGHRFGGKWPFGLGLLVTGILAIATPCVARFGGYYAIVGVRVLQGLAGGITVPCMHSLLARWIPPEERGKLTAIVYAGN